MAFPLPTGMGKTSAVVAFIAALERLGYEVPVSVAASKVEALCSINRELLAHGVNASHIGLKHSVLGASEPSTGNEPHLYQLVTHARVRSGNDFQLFGMFKGVPRALCLYDETLLRADCFAFNAMLFLAAHGALGALVEEQTSSHLNAVHAYLTQCTGVIREALRRLRVTQELAEHGIAVTLPQRDEATLLAWKKLLAEFNSDLRSNVDILCQFLDVSQEDLLVLTTQQGQGIVAVRQAVPSGLHNVMILDASTPIRELARLDPTITAVETFNQVDLKSFENVEVHQLLASGGRSAVMKTYGTRRETSAVSLEVLDIIKRELREDPSRCFLVFSFVARASLDVCAQLKTDLRRAGINLDARTPDGKDQFNFLTWGSHEGINGYEHCQTVILAGVLHRAHIDVAAAIKGQQAHLQAATPSKLVRHIVESEVAHCVYQAASRGSCRRVNNGKALPMRLHLIHRSVTLKTVLDKVMAGAVWSYPEPKHLKKAAADGVVAATLGRLLDHLRSLSDECTRLSTSSIKKAMGLAQDAGSSRAFTRAVGLLDLSEHGWTLNGRSLLRGADAYGFGYSGN